MFSAEGKTLEEIIVRGCKILGKLWGKLSQISLLWSSYHYGFLLGVYAKEDCVMGGTKTSEIFQVLRAAT